jgi:murein DD-endopeptidase MepM/ murein hydrolase activator NlpD
MLRQPRTIRLVALALVAATLVAAGVADYGSGGGYVVRSGDSLWAIATAHGITVDELAAANHLDPDGILPVGISLTIPGRSTAVKATYAPTSNVGSFCASLDVSGGEWGVLPAVLAASPARLALRPLFDHWAEHYGVPASVLEAVAWQESGWQQGTVSSTGAVGVGQIMPSTDSFVSSVIAGVRLDPASVSDNIRISAAFLSYLYATEGQSTCRTLAAYYEGPLNLATRGVFTDTALYVADVEALIPRFQ